MKNQRFKRRTNNRKILELLLSKLLMSYYPESNSHIRDKVKVVLCWTHYATKIETERAPGVDASNLAA